MALTLTERREAAAREYRQLMDIYRKTGGSARLLVTLDRLDPERLQPDTIIEPTNGYNPKKFEKTVTVSQQGVECVVYRGVSKKTKSNGAVKKVDIENLLSECREIRRMGKPNLPKRPHHKP